MQQNRTAAGAGGADLSAVASFFSQLMTLPFTMMMYSLDFFIRSMANMPGMTMPDSLALRGCLPPAKAGRLLEQARPGCPR